MSVVAHGLSEGGLRVFFDRSEPPTSKSFVVQLERGMASAATICVFFGEGPLGGWHEMEVDLATRLTATHDDLRVIPILLPGFSGPVPGFLGGWEQVDLRGHPQDKWVEAVAAAVRAEPSLLTDSFADERSWAAALLDPSTRLQVCVGALGSTPADQSKAVHYLIALIRKFSPLLAPIVADGELPFVRNAESRLDEVGWSVGHSTLEAPEIAPDKTLLIGFDPDVPTGFPTPDCVIAAPDSSQYTGELDVFRCDLVWALARILVHYAHETSRYPALLRDLGLLPEELRAEVLFLVSNLGFDADAARLDFGLPGDTRVPNPTLIQNTSDSDDPRDQTEAPSAISAALDALQRGDVRAAREIRGSIPSPDQGSARWPIASLDISLALAENDQSAAERLLRREFDQTGAPQVGCLLALMLVWMGRPGEALAVVEDVRQTGLSKGQRRTLDIAKHWAAWKSDRSTDDRDALVSLASAEESQGPSSASEWHLLSVALLDSDKVDEAISAADCAAALRPEVLDYRLQLAISLLQTIPSARDLSMRNPPPIRRDESIQAGVLLDAILGDARIAQRPFIRELGLHLKGIAHYARGVATRVHRERREQFMAAASAFEHGAEIGEANAQQLACCAGHAYLRAGLYSEASNALSRVPNEGLSADSHTALIVALLMDGRIKESIARVRRALEDGSLTGEALANVGRVAMAAGLPRDAKSLLHIALSGISGPTWLVRYLLGRVHLDLREFEDAERELWTAITLNSREPRFYSAHVRALECYIQPRLPRLMTDLRARAVTLRIDFDFVEEFDKRASSTLAAYRKLVATLSTGLEGGTVVSRMFEDTREDVRNLRDRLERLEGIASSQSAHDSEFFVASLRLAIDGSDLSRAPGARTGDSSTTPNTDKGQWLALQREVADSSAWKRAGLGFDDSGADVLAELSSKSEGDLGRHWMHLEARNLDIEARSSELRAYANTNGIVRRPYQDAVVRRAKYRNYGRLILADEVGLGKTIEACLILAEYRARGLVSSCLVLVPSRDLAHQWEQELADKFLIGKESPLELARYRGTGWRGFAEHGVCIVTYQAAVLQSEALLT